MSDSTFECYLQTVQFSKLLKGLGVQNVEALTEQIKHFTEKEAEKRDEIVLSYFGAKRYNASLALLRIVCFHHQD